MVARKEHYNLATLVLNWATQGMEVPQSLWLYDSEDSSAEKEKWPSHVRVVTSKDLVLADLTPAAQMRILQAEKIKTKYVISLPINYFPSETWMAEMRHLVYEAPNLGVVCVNNHIADFVTYDILGINEIVSATYPEVPSPLSCCLRAELIYYLTKYGQTETYPYFDELMWSEQIVEGRNNLSVAHQSAFALSFSDTFYYPRKTKENYVFWQQARKEINLKLKNKIKNGESF